MKLREYALVVAGGKGTRMDSDLPKQFMKLNGRPVLLHTLDAFYAYDQKITVILVLPHDDIPAWKDICTQFSFTKPHEVKAGGSTRFQSVKHGLAAIAGEGLVAIHDGVRPLVSTAIIAESFRLAAIHRSAVASVKLKESVRKTEGDTSKAVDRSLFRIIQTPQTFDVKLIREAYQIVEDAVLTDDASVAERSGHRITLFDGSYENIKITTPEDLFIAEALLKKTEEN